MHTKSFLAAATMSLLTATAFAQVEFTKTGDVSLGTTVDTSDSVFAPEASARGELGYFTAKSPGTYTLTYLGQDAPADAYLLLGSGQKLHNSSDLGSSVTGDLLAGERLSFVFESLNGSFAANEGWTGKGGAFAVIGRNVNNAFGDFDYVLGYSSGVNPSDWNDFTVGVKTVAAIPEPQTLALMLAGLGALTFVVRRRAKA